MIRLVFALCFFCLAAPAVAHVEVFPEKVPAGEPTTFTIRVPNEATAEGARTTTGVRVAFPDSVTVFSFRPPGSGFTVEPILGDNNQLTGVDYTGGRYEGERTYEDFELVGTAQNPGLAVWRVEQFLDDGSSALWTGPPEVDGVEAPEPEPNAPGPAAAIEIVPAGELAEGGKGGGTDSNAGLWLALIAAGLAVAALLLGGLLWSSRPMDLPTDSPRS